MNKEERKYIFAQLNSLPNAFQYVEVTNYIKSLEQENKDIKAKYLNTVSNYEETKSKNQDLKNQLEQANATIDTNIELIEHLNNKIYKAIEYIEDNNLINILNRSDLLEILKDSDVDE